jgi:exopolyphosphatase / guanosine-5'-triphosphate,3'-diphosphate pyrophosphatase
MKKFASIDIGTNTILMLIGSFDSDNNFITIRDEHRIARLGENLKQSGIINDSAIQRASIILSEYCQIIREEKVDVVKAIATSAIREAANQSFVLQKLNSVIHSEIEVVPGETEGDLTFLGTIKDNNENIVIDIGGGSTEIIYGNNYSIIDRISFKIGAVKLTEMFFKEYKFSSNDINLCREYIKSELSTYDFSMFKGTAYAVAGTPTTIAMVAEKMRNFDASIINNYIINRKTLDYTLDIFSNNQLDYLVNILKIDEKRADLMLAGNILLIEILNSLNLNSCKVSIFGLRYGIIKKFFNNKF